MYQIDNDVFKYLADHEKVLDLIKQETKRSKENIELIASENFCSDAVRAAMASSLVFKYSEGYPELERHSGNRGRYYGGCQYIDKLEEYCCDKFREAFDTDYHVNVQPHSGSQANFAAYMSVLKPGDTILSMSMDAGSHLTHSSPVSFVGKIFNVVTYGLNEEGLIDYDEIRNKIMEHKPKLLVAGASSYPRIIDFKRIKDIIDDCAKKLEDCNPYFMVDMAHIAGLVVSGDHPTPFGIADIITTTTHKTLRSARGGLVFCKPELAKKVDSAVFPTSQGGGLQHVVAAKAVGAEEACTEEFKQYGHDVVANCKAMCNRFIELGYQVVTGGTDNHLFTIDFSNTHPMVTGKMVQDKLDEHGITLNKNCVPGDKRKPAETSGVRIGTAAMTTKGYTAEDFIKLADRIDGIIKNELS